MIRPAAAAAAPSSSCSQSPSASSPLSVVAANLRSSRASKLVLACQGRQSKSTSLLPLWRPPQRPAAEAGSKTPAPAPITAPPGPHHHHQRRGNLVRLHLGPATSLAPAAVTNSRLRQGALFARRHQLPPPPSPPRPSQPLDSSSPSRQHHHLQSRAGAAGEGSLAYNQQRRGALAREISAQTRASSCCLTKTKSCLRQSGEQKKSPNPATRLGAATTSGVCGAKTAAKISLDSSSSSLTLAVVKRARQASATPSETSTGAHSLARHRIRQQAPLARLRSSSPSVASSGYQSGRTSASRSSSSSAGSSSTGDVQTSAAPAASANSSAQPSAVGPSSAPSDDNSAGAAVERTEPTPDGQNQNQNNNNTHIVKATIVAPKPQTISANHQHTTIDPSADQRQVSPVACSPDVAQRQEEANFHHHYYHHHHHQHHHHHKTMIISSSPSELDYGDSEEEGQVVKPPPPPASAAQLKQPPPEIPIRTDLIGDHYDLEARPFARGKFAQVKRCVHKKSKQCFAAKCIKKRRRLADTRNEILLEISALKLSYYTERIVKLYEVYETPSEIIFVLEMAKGGELQRVIDDEEVIDEHLVRRMVKQILDGLIQLHDNDIAHLDIKPQNLLLTEPFPNGDILLCDFGISRRITKDCEIRDICGTPDYVAPEILSYDPISLATDMWSLGVLTYVLLSGYSPFGSDNKQQTFCNITQAVLDFPSEIFDKISKEAIDFMQKLILREPTERLTSRQARQHPWLTNGTSKC